MSRGSPAVSRWRRCGCRAPPVAAQDPTWQTGPPPPPPYGSPHRFPDGTKLLMPPAQQHGGVCGVASGAGAHLKLLHRRHVVAEHAVLQHGDGVTLTAHFLDFVTSAVATGSDITFSFHLLFLLRGESRVNGPDSWVTHAVSMVTVGLQLHNNGTLKHKLVFISAPKRKPSDMSWRHFADVTSSPFQTCRGRQQTLWPL